ncbi:MFS transporter [Brachybacterium sp. YJGR34]|uniref:MFS transporter n=1 Tax=Brachybacterium sp. YJGR34 TaxID=2059911 RepID=UPI000E0BEA1A|nr:MFS transporter [Brachybacterium sp. YJGR34]
MSPLRRWTALVVLVLPVLLISIDMSVLGIAVPALSADLQPTSNQLLWIIDLYSFLLAGLLIFTGSLGDRIGRKRMLMIGAPLFGAASLVAAFATSPEMLILGRALLGIGGATLMPSTLGLIRAIFPDRTERRSAIAVWAAAFGGGAALGPVVGGLLLENFSWGSVFLLNVPVIVLFLLTGPFLLPEAKDPNPGPFDPISVILSIAGMISLVYALKTGVKGLDWTVLAALVLGIAALAWFITRQRRRENPMLDVSLFRNSAFTSALTINVITVFALMGFMFFLPQYLMLVRGMGSAQAGLWMLPLALATVVGTMLAPVVARMTSVRTVVMAGLALVILAFIIGTQLDTAATIVLFALLSAAFGLGVGLAETLTNDVILTAAPSDRAGAAAAISETGYEFGGAMGTAVLGTAGMAVYSSRVVETASLPGMDSESATAASQTLAGAHEVATTLPDGGARLREIADTAFMTGIDLVAAIGIGTAAITLVLAWRGLRSESRAASHAAAAPDEETMPRADEASADRAGATRG